MFSSTEKKNLVDNILKVVVIINVISAFTLNFFKIGGNILLVNLWIILILGPVVSSINNFIKQKHREKFVAPILMLKIGLGLISSVCLFIILFSENYNLKYTYWVGYISTGILVFYTFHEEYKVKMEDRISKGKKHNRLYFYRSILINFAMASFVTYLFITIYPNTPRQVVLDTFKTPKTAMIYKYSNNKMESDSVITIESESTATEIMKEVTKELHLVTLNNITGTEIINYERMRAHNEPYFRIIFGYSEVYMKENNLEDGYINEILITSNNEVVVSDLRDRKSFIFKKSFYNDIYPVNISKETIDKIFTYLN